MKLMTRQLWFIVIGPTVLSLTACKTRQKSSVVEDAGAEVKILLENLLEEDKDHKDYQYIVKDCGSVSTVEGRLVSPAEMVVRIKGVNVGQECDLFIINPEASQSQFGFRSDLNLLYQANNFKIGKNPEGALVATAYLQKQYFFRGNDRMSLKLPVTFAPDNVPAQAVVADLKCTPPIFFSSDSFIKRDEVSGDFYFNAIVGDRASEDHTCAGVDLFIDAKISYRGSINKEKKKSFRLSKGEVLTLVDSPLGLTKVPVEQDGIIVSTGDENKSCAEGKKFNTETRQCE